MGAIEFNEEYLQYFIVCFYAEITFPNTTNYTLSLILLFGPCLENSTFNDLISHTIHLYIHKQKTLAF